jgi:hypothetical protein
MAVSKFTLVLAGSLSALVAVAAASKPQGKTAAPAPAAQQPAAAPATGTVTGTVEETMDASNYTYMRLKTAQGETWAAVNKTVVKKGAKVTVVNAVPMDGFESKTLHRTFEHIVFGSLAGDGAAAPAAAPGGAAQSGGAMPPGHPPTNDASMKSAVAAQHAQAAAGPDDVGPIKVAKAPGASGRTVAEIYAQRGALKTKEVSVRGKVVKFTPNVMDKNWIHLRDGSGSHDKKDDDITVTTTGTAAVGEVVVATGKVTVDRDFGAGYSYPVLIENAKLSK